MPSPERIVRPVGAHAWLIECADTQEAAALSEWILGQSAPVTDVVPAMQTVLVTSAPGARAQVHELVRTAAAADVDRPSGTQGSPVRIDVHYDGPDLAWCAEALGMSVEHFIEAHGRAHWQVGFIGFAPGFAYLLAPDWPHRIPRLADPRPRVPAGAVAVADGFAGVYPGVSPGGWRLIGSTRATLWDPAAESPTPLLPGTPVRFRIAR